MRKQFIRILVVALGCVVIVLARSSHLVNKNENLIKEETEQTLSEEERAALAEQDRISKIIPYEGMDEKYINSTIVGKAETSWKKAVPKMDITKYYWYADNGKDKVLVVECGDGKVISVTKYYTSKYWDENGMPAFDKESPYNPESGMQYEKIVKKPVKSNYVSSYKKNYNYNYTNSDPYDVDDFDDPDDFADEWAEEFGDGNYDDGYDDAYEYWEDNY